MKTLADIADFLRTALKRSTLTQQALGARAGLARRTLTGVLSGQADYKVTTLMAVLDRLGYELAILPKDAAAGLEAAATSPSEPAVKTRVQQARDRLLAQSQAGQS